MHRYLTPNCVCFLKKWKIHSMGEATNLMYPSLNENDSSDACMTDISYRMEIYATDGGFPVFTPLHCITVSNIRTLSPCQLANTSQIRLSSVKFGEGIWGSCCLDPTTTLTSSSCLEPVPRNVPVHLVCWGVFMRAQRSKTFCSEDKNEHFSLDNEYDLWPHLWRVYWHLGEGNVKQACSLAG